MSKRRQGPEKRFENLLREALTSMGARVWKIHGDQYSRGKADLLIGYEGRLIFCECKAHKAKALRVQSAALWAMLAPLQMMEARDWWKVDCPTFVAAGGAEKGAGYVTRTGRSGSCARHPIKTCAALILGLVDEEEET